MSALAVEAQQDDSRRLQVPGDLDRQDAAVRSARHEIRHLLRALRRPVAEAPSSELRHVIPPPRPVTGHQNLGPRCQPIGVDRKSTRLNSSHLVISYAVFCLKNKIN